MRIGFDRLVLLAAAVFVVAIGAAARANVFSANGADPRRYIEPVGDEARFAAIGRTTSDGPVEMVEPDPRHPGRDIDVRDIVYGTGFMISPCLMMTNFHTVFGDAAAAPNRARPHFVRFEVGAGSGRRFAHSDRGRVVAWGDVDADDAADWAIVRLDTCPGADKAVGWLTLDPGPAPTTGDVELAGYAGDRDFNRLSFQPSCHIRGTEGLAIAHDCASRPGASGAPLMVAGPDSVKVVGLNFAGDEDDDRVLPAYDQGHANWAVDIGAILATPGVRALIEDDLKAHAAGAP